jgi:hypothetical protein
MKIEVKMKKLIFILILIFLFGCKKKDNPVEPASRKSISTNNYRTYIDSTFYIDWSDGSWIKYSKISTINGVNYLTLLNNSGYEYYYNNSGYCGYKIPPSSTIIFDKPLSFLPDTLFFNEPVNTSTTFYYNGNNYKLDQQDILTDTITVSIPIGIFRKCLWIKTSDNLTTSTSSQIENTEEWVAPIYGEIKYENNDGTVIVVTKSNNNGISLNKTADDFSSLNLTKGIEILNYFRNH